MEPTETPGGHTKFLKSILACRDFASLCMDMAIVLSLMP